MSKKIVRVICVAAAVLLLGFILFFVCALFGDPVSYAVAYFRASAYVEEKYSDKSFVLSGITYNFKTGEYVCAVGDPESIDCHFGVSVEPFGEITDYYESYVLSGANTSYRIDGEYRDMVDELLSREDLPFVLNFGYGMINFVHPKENWEQPDYYVRMSELEIDGEYDANAFGARAGHICIYAFDEDVSIERLSEILLDLRALADSEGVSFRTVNLILEHPREENTASDGVRAEVMDFQYSDIYADGLVDRVRASDLAAREYYAEMDKLK